MRFLKLGLVLASLTGLSSAVLVGSPALAATSCTSTNDGHGEACVNTTKGTVTVYDNAADGYSVFTVVTVGGWNGNGDVVHLDTSCGTSKGAGTHTTCNLALPYERHDAQVWVYTLDQDGSEGGGLGSTGWGDVEF